VGPRRLSEHAGPAGERVVIVGKQNSGIIGPEIAKHGVSFFATVQSRQPTQNIVKAVTFCEVRSDKVQFHV
jgi:hypothetical protein